MQFVFRNPHSYVHLEAPDEGGQMQRWAVEWGSGMQLSTQGLSATALKAGDHVIITGAPGRNPEAASLVDEEVTLTEATEFVEELMYGHLRKQPVGRRWEGDLGEPAGTLVFELTRKPPVIK